MTSRYIATSAALTVVVAVALAMPSLPSTEPIDLALAAVGLVVVMSPVRFHRGGQTHGLTLEDAVVGAFLLGPHPEIAPLALVVATLIGRSLLRPGLAKVVFGIAPVGLGAAAAVGVSALVGLGAAPLAPRSVASVSLALAVYGVVSFLVTAGLFRRLDGTTVEQSLVDTWVGNVITWVGAVTLALILAVVLRADIRGTALVGLLAVGVQLGYRAYGRMLADRDRAEQLAELNRSLAGVAAGVVPIASWLADVARFFGASAAVLREEGGELHASGPVPDEVSAAVVERPDDGGDLRDVEGAEVLVARVADGGRRGGALAVWERHGLEAWNEGDAHLLEAIASEAAVALENAELFARVEQERARWQEESAKLGDILSAASDGIATFGHDGRIASWNPGMTGFTGTLASDALDRPWWTVLRLRDLEQRDLLPEGDHVVTDALSGARHSEPVQLQVLRRDGEWRWLRATFSPLVTEAGRVDGTVMVARDVTAEREVDELKADFVATVSHELRTPLTPLKGFLATLIHRGELLNDEQVGVMHAAMASQVDRLESLVDDLLVVADLDRGRIRLGREVVTLRHAVTQAVADEDPTGSGRVTVHGPEDVTAAADAQAVIRIARALVSNALKHTSGPVTVTVERDGHDCLVSVSDDGPGIPPWEQQRIFQRFHRLGDHLLRTQGPGLGLAIARALAEHQGGSIELDSDVGRGARFTLRLRAAGPVPVAHRVRGSRDAG